MNVTRDSVGDKSFPEMVKHVEALQQILVEAAATGRSLHVIERGVLERMLMLGRLAIDATLRLQGDGVDPFDRGWACTPAV